jgi:putative ABC transport system permease protein
VRKALQITGMGLSALLGNWARSALTMLGIVIGVAAVILITSLGNGVQAQVTGQLDELGPNLITVSPGSGGEQGFGDEGDGGPGGPGGPGGGAVTTLTPEDARAVEALPSVSAASPSLSVPVPVGRASYTFTGVAPSYARISSVELETGRFVEREKELVLTADAAKDLLDSDPKGAIGEKLVVGGREYEVVGISKEATGGGFAAQPAASYMLIDDALALSGAENVSQIVALAGDRDAVAAAADDISAELEAHHGGAEDFSVITQEQLLSSFSQITDLLTYALAGIAGISLLVGGIGVMNIMLVSVTERTREIGVRKALGATNGDVLSQFLLEAVLLSVLGGLVGIAIGVGVSALLPILSSNLPTAVTWAAVGLAFGVSALIGVVFGVLPAYRSARLQPVEALRRE